MEQELNEQLKLIEKQEQELMEREDRPKLTSKFDPAAEKLKERIPDSIQNGLETAFFKAFQLVFDKGYQYIEKTYDKDKLQLEHQLNNYRLNQNFSKKHLKKLDKQSRESKMRNTAFSVLEGSVLGLMGIGLADIPLFIAIIIKTISETAISYGYDCDTKGEKAYMLLLICGAVAKSPEKRQINDEVDCLGRRIDQKLDIEVDIEEQIKAAAGLLSNELLTAKFLQGIPIVGVVGGAVNYNIIRKVGKYSSLKYKKRYLLGKAKEVK